ncbi:unnamed protein product, partial [Ostreobium quekettii]
VVQLGMYDNEASAARRWDMEALRLRGEQTPLNFPHLKPIYMKQLSQLTHFGKNDPDPDVVLYGPPPELNDELLAQYQDDPECSKKMAMDPVPSRDRHPLSRGMPLHAQLQASDIVIAPIVTSMNNRDPRQFHGQPGGGNVAEQMHHSMPPMPSPTFHTMEGAHAPIPILGGHPHMNGQSSAIVPMDSVHSGLPSAKALLKSGSSAVSETLHLATDNGSSPTAEPQGVKVVPETVLTHVRRMMESVVKAAEKDIQGAQERYDRAMDVLIIGEAMKREAQICVDVSRVRKEAAQKLLMKFGTVLDPAVPNSQEGQQGQQVPQIQQVQQDQQGQEVQQVQQGQQEQQGE